mmetsp:Transcript_13166/g.20665  ORF Transcript_13166/g.20665 Transcript_13166/m.20665 type:complete len:290 (-) Transcript_13166:1197-2066(-)
MTLDKLDKRNQPPLLSLNLTSPISVHLVVTVRGLLAVLHPRVPGGLPLPVLVCTLGILVLGLLVSFRGPVRLGSPVVVVTVYPILLGRGLLRLSTSCSLGSGRLLLRLCALTLTLRVALSTAVLLGWLLLEVVLLPLLLQLALLGLLARKTLMHGAQRTDFLPIAFFDGLLGHLIVLVSHESEPPGQPGFVVANNETVSHISKLLEVTNDVLLGAPKRQPTHINLNTGSHSGHASLHLLLLLLPLPVPLLFLLLILFLSLCVFRPALSVLNLVDLALISLDSTLELPVL